jgi:hypothetical protein
MSSELCGLVLLDCSKRPARCLKGAERHSCQFPAVLRPSIGGSNPCGKGQRVAWLASCHLPRRSNYFPVQSEGNGCSPLLWLPAQLDATRALDHGPVIVPESTVEQISEQPRVIDPVFLQGAS